MVDRHHPGQAPTAILHHLAAGQCQTIDCLAQDLNLTRRQVSDAAGVLLRRNYLDRMAIGCYQLTDAGKAAAASGEVIKSGPRGPREKVGEYRNSLRQRAWRAMRLRRSFSILDLVADAATDADTNAQANIWKYLGALARAGYVVEHPRRSPASAPTSNGYKRWSISRDTGPKAPAIRVKAGLLHDFNTGEDVPCIPG